MRFALKVSDQIIGFAAELTDSDTADFPDDLYLLVEAVSPVEYRAKFMTLDEITEEAKQDPNLQLI